MREHTTTFLAYGLTQATSQVMAAEGRNHARDGKACATTRQTVYCTHNCSGLGAAVAQAAAEMTSKHRAHQAK